MMMLEPFIVHRAAVPDGPVQRCAHCEIALQDNTAWLEGRTAVLDTDPDPQPKWWPAGARVAVDGGPGMTIRFTIPERPLEADEQLCTPA